MQPSRLRRLFVLSQKSGVAASARAQTSPHGLGRGCLAEVVVSDDHDGGGGGGGGRCDHHSDDTGVRGWDGMERWTGEDAERGRWAS